MKDSRDMEVSQTPLVPRVKMTLGSYSGYRGYDQGDVSKDGIKRAG